MGHGCSSTKTLYQRNSGLKEINRMARNVENDSPFISVIIPAFNEAGRIGHTLERTVSFCRQKAYRYEIIVIDDGSSDDTAGIVALAQTKEGDKRIRLLTNDKNRGKGFSVRRGVMAATGEYVLFSDADMSTPIEELDKLLQVLQDGCDVAIGSRGLSDSVIEIHQAWYRENMGKIFNKLVQWTVLEGISDTQCGFKCFRREVAHDIFRRQSVQRFGFDVEILLIARMRGYTIQEIPIVWKNSPESRVSPMTDAVKMLWDLLRLYFRWDRGDLAKGKNGD